LVYQKFQEAGGFFGARVKSIECYLTLKDGQCVSAVGCGPGFIVNVGDIDVGRLIEFHKSHGRLATVTTVPSPGRFGILDIGKHSGVSRFHEKPDAEMGWINASFFVLEPGVMDFIDGNDTIWEQGPLQALAAAGQLMAFRHSGFWKPMDTFRAKRELEGLWSSGAPPWKIW
jgi:glucose-1-phosphate cytidylyltransferase